jgi:hypothetical protein
MGRLLQVVEGLLDVDLSGTVDPTAYSWKSAFPAEYGPDDDTGEWS